MIRNKNATAKAIRAALPSLLLLFAILSFSVAIDWEQAKAKAIPDIETGNSSGKPPGITGTNISVEGPVNEPEYDFWVVKAYFSDPAMVAELAAW